MSNALSSVGAAGRWLLHSRHGVAAIAQTVATKMLVAVLSLATGIVTARVLGSDGRGEQSALLLWPGLLTYLLTLGIPTALRYWIRREPERRAELFTTALVVAIAMSVVTCAIGIAFIPHWLHQYSANVIWAAQVLMVFAPEVMVGLVLVGMLEALGDFSTANSTRYLPLLITLVALAIMALTNTMTPFRSAAAYLAPPVLTTGWLAWKLRAYFVRRVIDPRPGLRLLSAYGLRAYVIDILGTLSTQIDQVLVIGYLSAAEMGVYVVALNASRVLQILHSAVVTVVFPSASGLDPDRVVAMVGRAARISMLIASALGILLLVLLPVLIPLAYGSPFGAAVLVAQVLSVEAVIGGLVSVLAQAFMALGKPGLVTALQAIGLATAVPCMLTLMPRFGLMGAAISLLISTIVRLAIVCVAFPTILKLSLPPLIPVAEDIRSLRRSFARYSA